MIGVCHSQGTLWSCENPGRSFMRDTRPFKQLQQELPSKSTFLHRCQYGSARCKLTKFLHCVPAWEQLEAYCPNDHEHEPWGQKADGSWSTAEETAYPWPLARAMATHVVLELQTLGVKCHLPSFAQQDATLQSMRAASNLQPHRGLPPMFPDFKHIITQDAKARWK